MDLQRKSDLIKEQIESLQLPDGSSPLHRETCVPDMGSTGSAEYVHRFECGTIGEVAQTIEVRVSERRVDVLYQDHRSCDVQILGSADQVETAIEDIIKYLETIYNSAMKQKK
ncbi:MAG: hypothetical protein ISS70_04450 [Phycisphaerae bacterium]|nr:hypothetical protein [Phycisphaerae bacterium]